MFDIKFSNIISDSDLTILCFFENDLILNDHFKEFDVKSSNALSQILSNNERFKANFGQSVSLNYIDNNRLKYIVAVGLGKKEEFQEFHLEEIGGKIYNIANNMKVASIEILTQDLAEKIKFHNPGSEIARGILLASYKFDKYKTKPDTKKDSHLSLVNIIVDNISNEEKSFEETESLIAGIFLARNVISEPPNVLYPESYANIIVEELENVGATVTVIGESEMRQLGMNALLGVGQGSSKESKLVVIEYYGAESSDTKPVAFVGKGVTFDTGGISLKPSTGMADMKYDMAGSAAVVGLMKTLASRRAKVNAIGVVGLVENMPGGNAQRPSDVVKTMSGKTVEILDTDAEGRLVLADALWYTQNKFHPEIMVNLATLTGAITIALGNSFAGLFSNDKNLVEKLQNAGTQVNEKLWHMPLHKDYDEMIKSDIADIANLGNARGAGSSTAAQFLQHFVNNVSWAHLDIAGMAWEKKGNNVTPKGAVGFGIKLLHRLVKEYYESK